MTGLVAEKALPMHRRGLRPALLIACTALLATGTLLVRGASCGHDFNFHLLSWMEVARAWHGGLLYPHWVQDANYGAGEPRLIFYPPASWLLGAALGSFTSWQAAPALFVLFALLACGCGMYLLVRDRSSEMGATLAACLYIACPYTMFVTYERAAFGELLAAAWLPWLALYALKRQTSIAPLGLTVAALWLTNGPAAVIGSYLLALVALGLWWVERQVWPLLRAAGGMALGLGLAAFYIVPAAYEQRWVQIARAITPGMRVEDSFLFMHTADAFHDQVLHTASWIFVAEFVAAAVAAWLAWRKRTPANRSALIVMTGLLPVLLLLQFSASDWIWRIAPHLKFLQFPWRWAMVLSLLGCALAGVALPLSWRRNRTGLAGAAIAALAIAGSIFFFHPCDEEDAVAPRLALFQTGQGSEGTDEYTPAGADNASIQQGLPQVRVLRSAQDDTADSTNGENPEWQANAHGSIAAKWTVLRAGSEHWSLQIVSPGAGFAVLRLMDYPAWRVMVDGQPVCKRPTREDGLMSVAVHAGSQAIDVQWKATTDLVAGRTLSLVSVLGLVLVTVAERRAHRAGRV